MTAIHKPIKKKDKTLGAEYGLSVSTFKQEDHMWNRLRGSQCDELYNAFMAKDNYYYFEQVPMRYTQDEEQRFRDLETALNAKRDEYIQRFFSGNVDPNNDNDWNQYVSDMNKVGLQEFIELQETVYTRTKEIVEKEKLELEQNSTN